MNPAPPVELVFSAFPPRLSVSAVKGLPRLAPASRFRGIPFGWQSAHLTKWILWPLAVLTKVVSIFSTSRPQLDRRGWHVAHEARVCCPCCMWQPKKQKSPPKNTPTTLEAVAAAARHQDSSAPHERPQACGRRQSPPGRWRAARGTDSRAPGGYPG